MKRAPKKPDSLQQQLERVRRITTGGPAAPSAAAPGRPTFPTPRPQPAPPSVEDERITPDGKPAAFYGGAVSQLIALRLERGLLQAVDRVAKMGRMSRSEAIRYLIQRGMRTLADPDDGRTVNRRRQ